jgi:hypothetical protein
MDASRALVGSPGLMLCATSELLGQLEEADRGLNRNTSPIL